MPGTALPVHVELPGTVVQEQIPRVVQRFSVFREQMREQTSTQGIAADHVTQAAECDGGNIGHGVDQLHRPAG